MPADLLAESAWDCLSTEPGMVLTPDALTPDRVWRPIALPGSVEDLLFPGQDVDGRDWWFRTHLPAVGADGALLVFEGLASLCEIWIDGVLVAETVNMFRAHRIALAPSAGATLIVRCRSLSVELSRRRPRPRWKASIVSQQQLRWFRTTLLGRMPGVADTTPVVGPWRPVRVVPGTSAEVVARTVSSRLGPDGTGTVDVSAVLWAPNHADDTPATLVVSGMAAPAQAVRQPDGLLAVSASVTLPDVQPWWPHTHGASPLHPVSLTLGDVELSLPATGFRALEVDRSDDGFTVIINGERIFCRGVCWIPPVPTCPATALEAAREALTQLRDAGVNMVRLTGTTTTESDAFHDLCDELGMLVWHDCMIATLDLPDDDGFNAELAAEVSELCDRLSGRPSVVVLSGGTETLQQPAMLGLPLDQISVPAVQSLIPAIAQSRLPGVEYVVSSPSGGELPFHPGSGVAHYFGVGAYLRPLSDATLSGVRFAAESLAFAVPPERASVDAAFGGARAAGHTPQWKAGVPRDLTASWDFEDVRDHYVRDLFGVDPMRVRYSDADRYLDLGRAACAEAMVSAFTQWRAGDRCAGALILTGRDLVPGAGWGIVDSSGRAKAPWFSLRRVLAPVAVALRDNGMNGLTVDLHNDQADPIDATLRLTFFGPDGRLVDSAERAVELAPRSSSSRSAEGLLGYFRDVNHAYGFGPASFGFVSATLSAADGRELARDGRFVGDGVDSTPTLRASFRQREDGTWLVVVETDSPAQWVALDVSGHEPSDNWFHLAPGVPVEIELRNVGARADRSPAGTVRALNARGEVVIERAGS